MVKHPLYVAIDGSTPSPSYSTGCVFAQVTREFHSSAEVSEKVEGVTVGTDYMWLWRQKGWYILEPYYPFMVVLPLKERVTFIKLQIQLMGSAWNSIPFMVGISLKDKLTPLL